MKVALQFRVVTSRHPEAGRYLFRGRFDPAECAAVLRLSPDQITASDISMLGIASACLKEDTWISVWVG